jgi:hypothetical protein
LYLNLTRPDVAFKTNSLSRVPPGTDLKLKVKEARNLIQEVKQTKVKIKFAKIGQLEDLHLDVYADASLGGLNKGLKSTEGSLIFLRGQGSQCSQITRRSRGITRVCKSAISAETLALENAIDLAIGIGRQLKQLQTGERQEQPVPIKAFTDSESLTESIKSTKQVDEGSMRLHVERLKDFLIHKDIQSITWVPTHAMLADVLTKDKVDPTPLIRTLKTGLAKPPERERGESR